MKTEDTHPTSGEILDYFEGSLAPRRSLELETHFAECRSCVAEARYVRHFLSAVQQLDVTGRRATAWHTRAAAALANAAAGAPSAWVERLQAWRERGIKALEDSVSVIIASALEESGVLLDRSPSLPHGLRFAPASGPIRTLGETASGGVGLPKVVVAEGDPQTRVDVRGADRVIVIRLAEAWKECDPPLAMLLSEEVDSGPTQIVEAQRLPDGSCEARFLNVPKGSYRVVIEPIRNPGDSP